MSKNLTRKSLALGALVALGSSVIAGPAFAAPTITIEPAAGTSYSFISGERFDIKVFGNSEFDFTNKNLQWEITKTIGDAVDYTIANNGASISESTGTAADATKAVVVIDGGSESAVAGNNRIGLKVAATLATTVKVRAFIDANGSGAYEAASDLASNQETITFIKKADVTSTTVITSAFESDTLVKANVKFNNINNEQLDGAGANSDIGINFTYADGSALHSSAPNIAASWDTTDKVFKAEITPSSALAKDKSVKAQPLYLLGASAANFVLADDKIGTAVVLAVTTRKVDSLIADAEKSTTAAEANTTPNATASSDEADVALNSKFRVYAVAKDAVDASTNPVAQPVAGVTVTAAITVQGATLAADSASTANIDEKVSVKINGTEYTDSAKLPGTGTYAKISGVTDANGKFFVELETYGFTNGQDVTVVFVAEGNKTDTIVANNATRVFTGTVTNVNGGTVVTADGTAVNVDVLLVDQFGGAPTDNKYSARANWLTSSQTTNATATSGTSAKVVGGKATLSITDNGTGIGTNTYDIDWIENAGSGYTGQATDVDMTGSNSSTLSVVIKAASEVSAGAVQLLATSGGSLLSKNAAKTAYILGSTANGAEAKPATVDTTDFYSHDSRAVVGDVPTANTAANKVQIFGKVYNTADQNVVLSAIPSAKVTIAASGLQFRVDQTDSSVVWGKDTITFYADASGLFTVDAYSHKAGKQTVTVTSGAGTATLNLWFNGVAEDAGRSIAITAPAYILPGRTLTVAGLLTDEYGNGVKTVAADRLTIAYDGPGLPTGTLPTDTDADGKFSFKVLLGAYESGSGVVTVKYDYNNDGDLVDKYDITKTATVTLGAAPVTTPAATAAVSGSTGKFYVSATNAAAKKVVVKVAGKFFRSFTGTGAKKTVALKAPKGKHKVTVFVGGKLVTTKTITVK